MAYAPVVPLANAQLLEVAGGGFSEDYRRQPASDTPKWSGQVDAFLEERQNTKVGKDAKDELTASTLTIPAGLADVRRGDSVTYRHNGTSFTRRVQNLAQRELIGTTRLEFFDD